jgi:hypothetical protein
VTGAPLAQTAAILDLYRAVAGEIVCAVDGRVPEAELEVLAGRVDVLLRCEVDPTAGIERNLPWLFSQCSERWILRTDSDEVPGSALLDELPRLVRASDVLQYALPRRWLFPDEEHYLDERPWSEDWHLRLVRNEPVAIQIAGQLHTDVSGVEPLRYVDLPFYHLSCVTLSREEREAKALAYEGLRPGLETMRGWSTNNHYLPERFQRRPSSPVPPEDARLVAGVTHAGSATSAARRRPRPARGRASPVEIVPLEEIDRTWPHRPVPPSAYRATWRSVSEITELVAGQTHPVVVEVRNEGTETWPFGDQLPAIRLSYRWVSTDRNTVVGEGIPTPFTAQVRPGGTALQHMTIHGPLEPGDYVLQFCLVHVGHRWFAEGPSLDLSVRPA